MVEEYDSIIKNSAWEIVPRPVDKSVVGSTWIYKVKKVVDGSVDKYKARFVAGGFSQIEGIDYDESFAHVSRYSFIRSILALSAQMGWCIHQMDVKNAFLNGIIEEEVYIDHVRVGIFIPPSEIKFLLLHFILSVSFSLVSYIPLGAWII